MNLRGLFNFLSLRTKRDGAAHVSFPQREIEQVAEKMEASVSEIVPLAMAAFNESGRQQP
jgi:thymidylate synthase (FAD)